MRVRLLAVLAVALGLVLGGCREDAPDPGPSASWPSDPADPGGGVPDPGLDVTTTVRVAVDAVTPRTWPGAVPVGRLLGLGFQHCLSVVPTPVAVLVLVHGPATGT